MDFAQVVPEMSREQEIISTKKRLETFQFHRSNGTGATVPLSPASSVSRSHSRHGSVSSASFSGSSSTTSVPSASDQPSLPASDSRPSSFVGRPRPTSHHRRRSSVSTRADSADMMGITLPNLPASSSDDNINFGDKDSVRRRALQALEGRNDLGLGLCSNTVEIPEFSSQGIPQKPFDREFKLPAIAPSFGMSGLSGKRDSFGKFLSSSNSLKDQLHTLMEEEEEEEENSKEDVQPTVAREPELTPGCKEKADIPNIGRRDQIECSPAPDGEAFSPINPPASAASRHRPANLALRPLSLLSSVCSPSLPTPSLTPNARAGLRSFSLTPHSDANTSGASEELDSKWAGQMLKRRVDIHSNSSSLSSSTSAHQSSSDCGSHHSAGASQSPKRQSSISYVRSGSIQSQPTAFTLASLPTPGVTPTSERRESVSSSSSVVSIGNRDRRNASEDTFLHQSHASLLARIAELEHALSLRSDSRSRPVSLYSESNASASDYAPDEMLQLVADLKADRDELNRDIEGWRQRVKDLEHAKALLGHEKVVLERRLEAERREGWLRNEKLGLMEMEKNTLNRQIMMKEEDISSVNRRLESTQAQLRQARLECDSLREDAEVAKRQLAQAQLLLEARKETESELVRVREALAIEQGYRKQLISQLDSAGILETPRVVDKMTNESFKRMANIDQPRNNGLGFQSVDSACTTVDADEATQQALKAPFTLKAVEEESEMYHECVSEDEDELARYEDEDDLGVNFTSPTRSMSSCGSDEDFPRSLSHLRIAANGTPVQSSGGNVPSSRSSCSTPSPTSSPCPTPVPSVLPEAGNVGHANRASLSKTWTFPSCGQSNSPRPVPGEVDRFFGCLEDVETSPAVELCSPMDNRSVFSQRLQLVDFNDEDLPPFVLPAQKGAGDVPTGMLDVVLEEEEEDLQCDASDGRYKTSFPVSVSEDSLRRMSSPLLDDHSSTNSLPFVFPQMKVARNDAKPAAASLSKPSSEDRSKWMIPGSDAVIRPSGVAASKTGSSRSIAASRIPPPSPPRFIQAKTSTYTTPSPPRRKPVPSPIVNVNSASPSRLKPLGSVVSPQGLKKTSPRSTHGPTFIPQLKVLKSENPPLGYGRSPTSVMKHDVDPSPKRHESSGIFTASPQPLLQTFTNFFPLSTLPWTKNRSQTSVVSTREPSYVPKERQLARLRASMALHRGGINLDGEIDRCNRCRGDLISL